MGDIYSLETPENITITYPVAGVGSRFLATLIDTLLLGLVLFALAILTIVFTPGSSGAGSSGAGSTETGGFVAAAIAILLANIVIFGYYIFFELLWNGQSPGKRVMRLRVIGMNGYPVTPSAVLIRNVVRLVDFLPSFYAVGVITMIANRHARRLGDLAAGTMVVKEGRAVGLASWLAAPLPSGWSTSSAPDTNKESARAGLLSALDGAEIGRLTPEDEALVSGFLSRRHDLAPAPRYRLATTIATVVHGRIGGPPPRAPESYLEQVHAAWIAHRL